jgi:hypothetical protein
MFRKEFEDKIKEGASQRTEDQNMRPGIECWSAEDDFGRWVASHESKVRSIICSFPEFKDAPFCGSGFH